MVLLRSLVKKELDDRFSLMLYFLGIPSLSCFVSLHVQCNYRKFSTREISVQFCQSPNIFRVIMIFGRELAWQAKENCQPSGKISMKFRGVGVKQHSETDGRKAEEKPKLRRML